MLPRIITNITEFSDDILLNIFSKLSCYDLLNVLDTCLRFSEVGTDHSLWKKADFNGVLTASQVVRRVLPCLHSSTSYIHLKGCGRKNVKRKADLITPNILNSVGKKCTSLTELCISEAIVNAKKLKLENFQELSNVHTLSFVKCEFICLPSPTIDGSYFKNMFLYLPKLENLEVSYSNWITDFDLMVLSKLDNLKSLILKCDLRIGFTIAYLAISFRYGFKSLEELDLRGTSLQNSDVQSVVQSGKLRTLKLGPIGRVKRLTNDLDMGLGLVIPDLHHREEPKQQIVVINMNPNGPRWRHANDEDLEEMGLQWVKKELDRLNDKQVKQDREPFFVGKEGCPIEKIDAKNKGETSGQSSIPNNTNKRKGLSDSEEDEDYDDDNPTKRLRTALDADNSEEEQEDKVDQPLPTEEKSIPDEGLSDLMVPLFKYHAKNIKTLVLNGCSITDSGLNELVKHLPSLKYIDISNTYVTQEGIQRAQVLHSKCQYVNNKLVEDR